MIDDSSMRIAITNVKAEKSKVAAVDKTSHIWTWEAGPASYSKAKARQASSSKVVLGETHECMWWPSFTDKAKKGCIDPRKVAALKNHQFDEPIENSGFDQSNDYGDSCGDEDDFISLTRVQQLLIFLSTF